MGKVSIEVSFCTPIRIVSHQGSPTGKRNASSPTHNKESHITYNHNMKNSRVSSPKGSVKRCLFNQEKDESDASVGNYADNSFLSKEETSDEDASVKLRGKISPSECKEKDSNDRDYVNNDSTLNRTDDDELDNGYEEVDPG